jgi:hypothetical protein
MPKQATDRPSRDRQPCCAEARVRRMSLRKPPGGAYRVGHTSLAPPGFDAFHIVTGRREGNGPGGAVSPVTLLQGLRKECVP